MSAWLTAGGLRQRMDDPGQNNKDVNRRKINIDIKKKLKQHYQPEHATKVHSTVNSLTPKRIADSLKQLEVKPPIPDFSNNTRDYEAINSHALNALNAYTEELNHPLQEQLSMLAGIDFYV